jgi:hypothetical protein
MKKGTCKMVRAKGGRRKLCRLKNGKVRWVGKGHKGGLGGHRRRR